MGINGRRKVKDDALKCAKEALDKFKTKMSQKFTSEKEVKTFIDQQIPIILVT
jgi:hypothetical protein